jgi:hypothetical protein
MRLPGVIRPHLVGAGMRERRRLVLIPAPLGRSLPRVLVMNHEDRAAANGAQVAAELRTTGVCQRPQAGVTGEKLDAMRHIPALPTAS